MPKTNGDAPRELFLIDGNSLAYRAFFALPESIATSDGRPTNAIFGFASMLVKILTDYGEVPTVVVWDAGMSGRKELSADYKAQRSSRPDLLKLQWPHLRPLVEAFGYRNISVEGFEADDVIAALVEQAREREIPVMVVTGDRDAYQLVGDGVRIMTTSRGITDTKVYDRQGVIDRYGIPPELVPDFIGLKGDTSDNIPGVPGIGDKTASDLLQRFGDLETVLASVDEISGAKRKQNLTEFADAARLSKQLATMVRDVPIDLDLEAEVTRRPDRAGLREIFREWELRDPLRRLEEALAEADIELHRRELLRDARIVGVVGEVLLALGAGDLVDRVEHRLERAELLKELSGGFVADPRDAGDVVGGIALEADQVGNQLGRHAVALNDSVRVVDLGVGDTARRRHDPRPVTDELVDVPVARDDHHGPPPRLGLSRERRDHVVGLESLDMDVGESERLGKWLKVRPLLAQEVGPGLAASLVLGVLLLSPRHPLVPGDDHGAGRVVDQKLGHHRCKAVNGIRRAPVGCGDRLGQREERAVGERVAVDQEELAVDWLGRCRHASIL